MPADYSLLKSIVTASVTCLLSAMIGGAHASEEQDDGFNLTEGQ